MALFGPRQLRQAFDAYSATLVLYARQWLDPGLAEDAVQDVFLRLVVQRVAPGNVKAWLFRAVRNAALNRARSQRRRRKHERGVATSRPHWFEARPDQLVSATAARAALASLPREQREVVILRIWGEMTLSEVADVLDQPVSTLWSRYRAGLTALRKMLELSCQTRNT